MGEDWLSDIRRRLTIVRHALEESRRRVAALRGRPDPTPEPLFPAAGTLDDVELHFEVLGTEDPEREER
jgi:hypothetical protein